MRWIWGFLVLAGILGVGTYATYQSRYILLQEERANYVGLQQSANGLTDLNAQGQKAITIALSEKFFDTFATAIKGKTLQFVDPSLPGEILTLTVNGVSFHPRSGTLQTQFDFQMSSDKRSYSVGLEVIAVAYFAGIEQVSSDPTGAKRFSANFGFIPTEVDPKFRYGLFNLIARGFVSKIIAGNLVQNFLNQMKIPLLYNPDLKYVIDQSGDYQQHFGDNPSNVIKYHISQTPLDIEKWLHVNSPIFTKRGIIFSATVSDEQPLPTLLKPDFSDSTIESRAAQLRSKIEASEKKIEPFYSSDAITVVAGRDAISDVGTTVSSAIRKLRLALQSYSISGRFIDKRWSDKILGDGGFYAEAAGGDRLHGSVTATGASINYQANSGLSGSLSLAITADADLHIHIDPLIGGGVGTTVKLLGSANPSVSAGLHTGTFPFEGHQVGFAAPVVACTAVDLQVQTDGKLAFAGGWVNVPSIGIRSGQLVGKDPLDPVVISSIPSSTVLIPKPNPTDSSRLESQFTITQGLYLTTTIPALDVQASENGYRFSASPDISISADPPDTKKANDYEARVTKAAQAFWRSNYSPSCPPPPDVRVLVGDLEFGPNNEIIKFIRNAWNDITKGPGKNNEVVKLLNRVNAAAGSYDEETKKLASQLGEDAQKAFGGDAGIGHAAGELTKSVTKAVTNPVGAAGDFGKQLFNGFK